MVRLQNLVLRRDVDDRLHRGMEIHAALQPANCELSGLSGSARPVRGANLAEHRLRFIETLVQDLRFAVRILTKSPGFTAIVIGTIAVGVGATTAIFILVDSSLLHPLAYPRPQQLVHIQADLPGVAAQDIGISVPELQDLQHSGLFQYVSAYIFASVNLTGSAQPARVAMKGVTPAYFAVLGVEPQLGHSFDPNDATPGFNLDVIISDGLWKRAFGSDPQILGRSLRLDNDAYRIIGVMPPGFRDAGLTNEERDTELWAAGGFAALPAPPPTRSTRWIPGTIARLMPGITVEQAQSRLDVLAAGLRKQFPADYPPQNAWTLRMMPLALSGVGDLRQSLLLVFGAVGLVLLIGCVNVANLLLARNSARTREIAVRQALGAARPRLIRQLLTESLLLFFTGGLVGLFILICTKGLLLNLIPESFPKLNNLSLNWSVMGFAFGLALLCGVIFGLAPAWLVGRLDLMTVLRREGRGSSGSTERNRIRRALVVGELALSLVLMVASGLLLRSFWDLFRVQPGFHPESVMTLQTWLPLPNDPKTDIYGTVAQETALIREILRRAKTLPGVEEAAVGNVASLPLGHNKNDLTIVPMIREDNPIPSGQEPLTGAVFVTPEYFHTLGIALQRGRVFTDKDVDNTPVTAIINEAAARAWWPHEEPVGRHLKFNPSKPWMTIVGVVADARTESLDSIAAPRIYLSLYQRRAKDLTIFLRGRLDPGQIPSQMRQQVQSIDSELPVFRGESLSEVLSDSLAARRFSMQIVALFALTALLLAMLGVYGTISYMVGEQTIEIGIRLALGAEKSRITRMVLRQGMELALAGVAVGLLGALFVSRLMTGLLYGASPHDPLTFVSVTILLSAVALAACLVPARRATNIDPIVALKNE
jgi:putative ABC transport system permease protein